METHTTLDRRRIQGELRGGLLKLEEVCGLVKLGKTQIYALVRSHQFPAPVHPTPGSSRWKSSEVYAWIRALTEERARNQPMPDSKAGREPEEFA